MTEQSPLSLDIKDNIATVTLNRPEALNALNAAMSAALHATMLDLENDTQVRAVVIQGSGGHFMAGGDITLFGHWVDLPAGERQVRFERMIAEVHRTITAIKRMPKPVLASVEGAAAGFGLSLMMACDLAIAADTAVFTLAYINIGTSPDGTSTHSLPRLIGQRKAMELALLGDRFDAATALHLGLINRMVPLADLAEQTAALAGRLAAGPGYALARTKALINGSFDRSFAEQMLAEEDSFARCTSHPDFREGVQAFLGKRKPKFSGS